MGMRVTCDIVTKRRKRGTDALGAWLCSVIQTIFQPCCAGMMGKWVDVGEVDKPIVIVLIILTFSYIP